MNRVWKIIEERKSGSRAMSGYRMPSAKKGMSGRKESGEYKEGVKDGLCAALDIIEDHIHDLEEE